jgi:hypothetical protein
MIATTLVSKTPPSAPASANHAGAVLLLDCARSIGQTTTPQSLLMARSCPARPQGSMRAWSQNAPLNR